MQKMIGNTAGWNKVFGELCSTTRTSYRRRILCNIPEKAIVDNQENLMKYIAYCNKEKVASILLRRIPTKSLNKELLTGFLTSKDFSTKWMAKELLEKIEGTPPCKEAKKFLKEYFPSGK